MFTFYAFRSFPTQSGIFTQYARLIVLLTENERHLRAAFGRKDLVPPDIRGVKLRDPFCSGPFQIFPPLPISSLPSSSSVLLLLSFDAYLPLIYSLFHNLRPRHRVAFNEHLSNVSSYNQHVVQIKILHCRLETQDA